MIFKKLKLDDFQEFSIKKIDKNHSVIVNAPTGTGKTLIADYLIDKYLKFSSKKVIYTSPIKALSNQKFKDFKQSYGSDNIGLLTGDIVYNPNAQILIMTTEIYRNMLLSRDNILDDIEYVIFDEIHYMSDPERGTVWEESIIFSPNNVRFLCLSATIPNAQELSSWIQNIKNHKVDVIQHSKRAVPLKHFIYEKYHGLTTSEELIRAKSKFKRISKKSRKRGKYRIRYPSPYRVISKMHDELPAIVFSFSRKDCEFEAKKLSEKLNFINSRDDKQLIINSWREHFNSEVNHMKTTENLRNVLIKGIGFHHAGLLPQHKVVVEELFSKGILKVLFTTETFSVGINMPAKTVIFNGFRKFDGRNFRLINSREYFQLAGRAGRRGIDDVGYVVTLIDSESNDINNFIWILSSTSEPIKGQFKLSYNTVLNLVANHNQYEIDKILKSNFEFYIKQKDNYYKYHIKTSFNNKLRYLKKLGYISPEGFLTNKGIFAQNIYYEELLISELFSTDLYKKFSDTELLQVIAGIIYEQRKNDHFSFHNVENRYKNLLNKIKLNSFVFNKINKLSLKRMMGIVGCWSEGSDFNYLINLTKIGEGDIIRLFRRIIDMIGQIIRATDDMELKDRLMNCQEKIDRGLVAVDL